jgi:hypothetical protein
MTDDMEEWFRFCYIKLYQLKLKRKGKQNKLKEMLK